MNSRLFNTIYLPLRGPEPDYRVELNSFERDMQANGFHTRVIPRVEEKIIIPYSNLLWVGELQDELINLIIVSKMLKRLTQYRYHRLGSLFFNTNTNTSMKY